MDNNLTIKVDEPANGLYGGDELWITVTGPDPLPDYGTIRDLVAIQHGRDDLPRQPLRYFPAWGGPEDPYEELWVVRKATIDRKVGA